MVSEPPRNTVLVGECVEILRGLPSKSVDCIFADPPYNLQLSGALVRTEGTQVEAVTDAWDRFDSPSAYETFCADWLAECRRVLKDDGTIWVIGSYHNIYVIGYLLAKLDFWLLNDVHWVKTNPMPNFNGTRFQNATETMLWAQKKGAKRYTFNYHAMKALNDDKQMRNTWELPICQGGERLVADEKKLHPTQKPLSLLYRVVLASTNPGDVILDPFFGTGTTGVAAKALGRDYIGIEQEARYAEAALARCEATPRFEEDIRLLVTRSPRTDRQVPFASLVEAGVLRPGTRLISKCGRYACRVRADGSVISGVHTGSIHTVGKAVRDVKACNGWDFWGVKRDGTWCPLDALRAEYVAGCEAVPAA